MLGQGQDFLIGCNIKSPPSQVLNIHDIIIKREKVQHDPSGPTLVTVVNSSRIKSDIDRDVAAANLSGTEAADIILLRIIPTGDPKKSVVEVKEDNIKIDLLILVDPSGRKLHECQHNEKQFEKLEGYFKISSAKSDEFNSMSDLTPLKSLIGYNIKSPPSQVLNIHDIIIKRGKLQHNPAGPTLVTVVNSSRIKSDIDRDLVAANLSGTEAADIILLRIIPTGDPKKKVVEVKEDNIKIDLAILVDPSGRKIHECRHNEKQFEKLVGYFKISTPKSAELNSMNDLIPLISLIGCNIKSPPSQVLNIHDKIIKQGKLQHNPAGPTLVTVVNSSRLKSDIDRDLSAANLSAISEFCYIHKIINNEGTEAADIILLRIIPTGDPKKKVVEVKEDNIKIDLAILVDPSGRKIHECRHNEKQFEKLVGYFKISTPKSAELNFMNDLIPLISLIGCNIKSPPSQVLNIHDIIIKQGKFQHDPVGPTLVTVVNSSRIKSDMDRDLAAANLSGTEAADIILLRTIPTGDPKKKVVEVKEDNIKIDLAILVDPSGRKLHECQHNEKQFEKLVILENIWTKPDMTGNNKQQTGKKRRSGQIVDENHSPPKKNKIVTVAPSVSPILTRTDGQTTVATTTLISDM